ncbi:MAG: hypothetical protein LPD71_11170 [Shewanella sp.]|nr:hypothetical protein [Shewanella sp.]MCF1430668.1 hypothetical protein [Shewanella sp.]MCF1439273.1 hypothetical protein [Shewanella sp.]MCF1457274.1 hypothetical protein [Shewanella sp.]
MVKVQAIYWYNKEVHPGRKVGHLNLDASVKLEIQAALNLLKRWMPTQHQAPLSWVADELK